MSKYAGPRLVVNKTILASQADNTNLDTLTLLPAGKEVEIYGMEAGIRVASGTASATVEVVRSSAPTTALCEVAIDAAGAVTSTDTFPITVTNTTATDQYLLLRANGATHADIVGEVIVHLSYPGVA
jgi:hypothetical protein